MLTREKGGLTCGFVIISLSLRIFKPVPEDLSLRILFVPEDFREFRIDAGKWGIDVLHRYY